MKFREINLLTINLVLLVSAVPTQLIAGNGLYLIGYGNESVLMGRADVAVARDAFATNNNPAGMTQLSKQAADPELVLDYHNHRHPGGSVQRGLSAAMPIHSVSTRLLRW